MAAPKTTIWELEPHTAAKHEILRRYLSAWFPILTLGGFKELTYIDGFAGPGRYSKGEDGSPVIALKTALNNPATKNSNIHFLFVELDRDRAEMLKNVIKDIETPSNFNIEVRGGMTFEAGMKDLLNQYERMTKTLPPTFAFVDPFGWAGVPFQLIQKITSNQSCEALVTFMYEEINRFLDLPDQVDNFDVYFGTKDWRNALQLPTKKQRNDFLRNLYARQLTNEAHNQYVRHFQMMNSRGLTDYYLFYATNSLKGQSKMKEAMWKVDESGDFTFSDATDMRQAVFFKRDPQFDVLEGQILSRFKGKDTTVREVEKFILVDTAFRETHYKQILKKLEITDKKIIPVNHSSDRRPGTYVDPSLSLKFLSS